MQTNPLYAKPEWILLSIPPTLYPPLSLTAKQSRTQWDRLVREEDVPLLGDCQHYPKPGHSLRSYLYLPPLLCKPCMSHSHCLRAHTLIYLHSINNKVNPQGRRHNCNPTHGPSSRNVPWTTAGQWQAVKPP